MAKNWFTATAREGGKTPEVCIYDEIGAFGVTASEFNRKLKTLGLRPGDQAVLRLNTPGGDCFAGNAIFNMLADTGAKWTIYVDGVAASMGSLIAALPGARVIMAANAYLMLHNPAALSSGESKDMRRTAALLDSIRQSMATAYAARSGLSLSKVLALMDAETWLDADEAIRLGFADEKAGALKLAASFGWTGRGYSHVPETMAHPTMGALARSYWSPRGRADKAVPSGSDDISDLVPTPHRTSAEAIAAFSGRHAGRRG